MNKQTFPIQYFALIQAPLEHPRLVVLSQILPMVVQKKSFEEYHKIFMFARDLAHLPCYDFHYVCDHHV